jgi:hypothetical protein
MISKLKSKQIFKIDHVHVQDARANRLKLKYIEIFNSDPIDDYKIYLRSAIIDNYDKPMKGYVYFIGNKENGYVKIGYSLNPVKRRNMLQTSCPFPLEIIYLLNGDVPMERRIQKVFKQYKTDSKNEWFNITGDLERCLFKDRTEFYNL